MHPTALLVTPYVIGATVGFLDAFKRAPDPQLPPEIDERDPHLLARLDAMEQRISQVVTDAGLLRMEWAEVLDKVQRWSARQAARDRRAAIAGLEAAAPEGLGATNGIGEVSEPSPTDRMALKAALRRRIQSGGRE